MAAYLNTLVEADPEAMRALVGHRVPCNRELRDHPTAQVGVRADGTAEIGLLGVLNGFLGTYPSSGWGPLSWDPESGRFRVLSEHETISAQARR